MSSSFFFTFCTILITELIASSISSLSQFPGNMDCQIVGNTDSVVNYQLTITLENDTSAETSRWNLIAKMKSINTG